MQMTCGVVEAVWSRAAAPPVAGSCIFDPSLLPGDQALHELGPFPLVGLHALACQQLADLRSCWSGSLGAVASNNPIETLAGLVATPRRSLVPAVAALFPEHTRIVAERLHF
jgi:hypothetical protein